MIGAIRRWHILSHMIVTIRCFGWRVFLNSLLAGRQRTFLTVLSDAHLFPPPSEEPAQIIGRCVQLELCAMKIYQTLADRFANFEHLKKFLDTLAEQEKEHAEILCVCQTLAGRGRWQEGRFSTWTDAIHDLENQVHEWESGLSRFDTMASVLQLVVDVEAAEINSIFADIVRATDSEFVREIDVFWNAEKNHILYICQEIPKLMPGMTDSCADLAQKYGFSMNEAA